MGDAIYVIKNDVLDLISEENEAGGFTDYSNYSNLWDEVDDMPAADVQPVDRWISCKDRLPEENILVLCYARSTTGEGNDYFLGALAHGEFWFFKVNDIGHVSYPVLHWEITHWQPLPESPKED